MPDLVETERRDALALIRLTRPPANVLTPALRLALNAELSAAQDAPEIRAIVLTGAGPGFCPGVDVSEYDGVLADPWVDALCTRIEMSSKPVVAALHGAVMGAGFELALAAHARVAHNRTRFAMPDIKLNMIPGGGATQRLPRLLGAQAALELLLSGQTLFASDIRLNRLMAQLTEGAPVEAACQLAMRLADGGGWRRVRDETRGFGDPEGYQSALSSLRRQITSEQSAAADMLRCVEAAQLLPFEQGLQFEQSLFRDRLMAPDARAARHILMAERYAALPPKSPRSVTAIRQVALYGSRDRLGELALTFIAHDVQVAIVTAGPAEAAAFDAWVARRLQNQMKAGELNDEEHRQRMARLDTRTGPGALAQADLIFDDGSVPGTPQSGLQPHAIWVLLGRDHRPDARRAQLALSKPVLPVHLWQPVIARAVAEVTFSAQQDMADVAGLMAAMNRIGISVLLTKARAGEIEHRLSGALFRAGLGLMALGARPDDVDAAARRMGLATGPCEMMDRAGLPKIRAQLGAGAEGDAGIHLLERVIGAGRTGQSTGQGFYAYRGGQASADPLLDRLLPGDAGAALSAVPPEQALLAALANAAAEIMAAGLLRRASEIDLAMVNGMGFDRARGGPLLQVDLGGLFSLYKDMRALGQRAPVWVPHARIETMVKNGDGFFGRSIG
ncbi:enoyl-CoA hydratase/isomerase family protein [Roseovarius faecimaris]|uniref:enoyl-CoA hydratase/isomerase family protein n=1 Tax=Roseovarius faecimaris TaxID=2494550 RepID=UPI0018E05D37|nr:enoyl-CoA hydratase/isomerase family protein [Roseovarius faecimaris]